MCECNKSEYDSEIAGSARRTELRMREEFREQASGMNTKLELAEEKCRLLGRIIKQMEKLGERIAKRGSVTDSFRTLASLLGVVERASTGQELVLVSEHLNLLKQAAAPSKLRK